jgi:hypothetical protein
VREQWGSRWDESEGDGAHIHTCVMHTHMRNKHTYCMGGKGRERERARVREKRVKDIVVPSCFAGIEDIAFRARPT